ncbi:MAG: RNA polymerase subunit sigma-24 [Prosthecobacter sp.]|uniref:RNA polymerase sigma factor n=1 Tax=Prosthecobacter sp. TaxID=1965333 RepID=UPI001A0E5991|nr:sigma factor [Prosthecobacter sp.]MBE2282854.1 RNA polymerase subunit sigma-24 [Prosthecobacter sp.]
MSETARHAPDPFLTTRWSIVLKARSGQAAEARRALNDLCSAYWYPIYAYIRRTCDRPQDAEDLTQGYFAGLLERQYLDQADKSRGKLRAFLLTDVKLYLSNERTRQTAAKRGGGRIIESYDQALAEQRYGVEPLDSNTPEQLFDRAWAATLLQSVQDALRHEFATRGQTAVFDALQQFIAWNAGDESYADVAAKLGKTVGDIKVSVHRLRKRYRALLEQTVSDTVTTPDEVKQEIAMLAAAFS